MEVNRRSSSIKLKSRFRVTHFKSQAKSKGRRMEEDLSNFLESDGDKEQPLAHHDEGGETTLMDEEIQEMGASPHQND